MQQKVISNSFNVNVVYDGENGKDGKGVVNVNIYYLASASQPPTPSGAPPQTGWADDGNSLIIADNADKHLYESSCSTYTDGSYSWTRPVDDGLIRDMASAQEQFALSSSGTAQPTSGWATSVTPQKGKWIWSRTVLTFKDGSTRVVGVQCVGYCGEDGSNAIRLDISNEMDMIPTTAALRIDVARTVETTVRLFDGATEVDISSATVSVSGGPASTIATFSQAASGKGRKLSWAFKAGQTMAAAYEITVSYTYKSVAYTAVFTVSASKGEAVWQLKPSLSAIPFQRNADNTLTPASRAVGLSLVKIDGGSTATYTSAQTGLTVRYSTSSMPSSASAGTGWSSGNITVANSAENLYIALFNAAGTLLDRETVPVVKDGENGKSITKKSESYRYATNNTGTRPAASSSDWKTTKPTLQKGYWLFTETTITWSDNSTTVLYTDERNPNDGVAGQDIIVDGSTEMKYYVGDSNTTHPAESSSDWKDLSQVTQTQGKWLWSKATTYYRKASSAAGSKDAGHSVNYNVSYISKDGAAGRAVTGITEYYKATNSNAEMPVPTSDTGWSTNPNVSNWGATDKYLWNYEKVTYSSGTTVERTKPQIVAIWTKDGKGIDSITNYYKITSSATPPSKPSTDGGDGWDDDPTAPGAGEYLWNYEKVTYTDGSVFYSEVQLIGHVGTNGAEGKGIKLTLNRNGLYTDAQWDSWCAIGHTESWSYSSGDPSFTDCRVGDIFVVAGSSSDTGRNHVAQFRCTSVSSSSITGVCISHIADGESIQGAPGHTGRFYYFAGAYDGTPGHYRIEETQAPYVKVGTEFYMLDLGGVEPGTIPYAATQSPSDSSTEWTLMQSAFAYYIAQAFFGENAYLGSFIINGDWMITKYGLIFDSGGVPHLIDNTHSYSGYSPSNAYTLFNPNYPNSSRSGYLNFCPAWAVDGMVGRQYHNGTFSDGSNFKAGSVSIDAEGFAVIWGGEGIRVGANGIQRYDSVRNAWLPMYNRRNVKIDSSYESIQLQPDVDYFLNTNTGHSSDNPRDIFLPPASSLPEGAMITIRGIRGAWGAVRANSIFTDRISISNNNEAEYVNMESADCYDFILLKHGFRYNTWLCNAYDRNV